MSTSQRAIAREGEAGARSSRKPPVSDDLAILHTAGGPDLRILHQRRTAAVELPDLAVGGLMRSSSSPTRWAEPTAKALIGAIEEFNWRERRYGAGDGARRRRAGRAAPFDLGPLGGDFGIRPARRFGAFRLRAAHRPGGRLVRLGGAWPAIMAVEWERMTQQPFLWAGVAVARPGRRVAALATLLAATTGPRRRRPSALVMTVHAQIAGRHRRWASRCRSISAFPPSPGSCARRRRRLAADAVVPVRRLGDDPWAMIAGSVFKGPLLAAHLAQEDLVGLLRRFSGPSASARSSRPSPAGRSRCR